MTMLGAAAVTPIFALLWSLVVLLSFVGWGYLASRLLPRNCRAPAWGLLAAWGMAVLVALGGALNLFALISPSLCVALVPLGSAVWLFHAFATLHSWKALSASRLAIVAPAKLIYLSAIALLFSLGLLWLIRLSGKPVGLNGDDDFHAYLVFPLKMLEAGWLAPNPFNVSRTGSLGGQAFLQTLLLAALPVGHVHLIDKGVCLIIRSAFSLHERGHIGVNVNTCGN